MRHAVLAAAFIGLGVLMATAPGADAQETIRGVATVKGPDKLVVGGTEVRLFGIDAPEARQPCFVGDRDWDCGTAAAKTLLDLAGDQDVECDVRLKDRFRRIYAVCRVRGEDINAALTRAGMALAVRSESEEYVDDEESAAAAKAGMWRGTFLEPWNFREKVTGVYQTRR